MEINYARRQIIGLTLLTMLAVYMFLLFLNIYVMTVMALPQPVP